MHPFAPLSLVVALAWAGSASAQSAPAAAASAPSDRAQRDADKVFRMILMHADKPRRAAARDDKAAAAPAPGAAASRTAPPARPAGEAAATPDKPVEVVVAAPTSVPPPAVAASVAEAPPVEAPTPTAPVAPLTAAAAAAPAHGALPEPAVPKNTKLELIQSEEPVFPSRLVRQLGNGAVVVRFDVRPDGTVVQPEVVRSSHRGLNAAAVAAVSAWRFKPVSETAQGIVELKFE